MKKLLNRIAPLLLALVMVMGSCLTVSAAGKTYTSDELKDLINKNNAKNYSYCFVLRDNWSGYNRIYLQYLDVLPYHSISNNNKDCLVVKASSYKFYSLAIYDNGNTEVLSDNSSASIGSLVSDLNSSFTLLYSNVDIYDIDSKEGDEPFFRGPERPLVAAVRGASPEETLKEVILLIPLSILFLAGCLGLRKALRLLLTLLRRA